MFYKSHTYTCMIITLVVISIGQPFMIIIENNNKVHLSIIGYTTSFLFVSFHDLLTYCLE